MVPGMAHVIDPLSRLEEQLRHEAEEARQQATRLPWGDEQHAAWKTNADALRDLTAVRVTIQAVKGRS
jgi:hypothetical protein